MDTAPTIQEILLRLVLAIVLGGVLGLERELQSKPAGLRTHMMVALGSTTFTLVTIELYSSIVAAGHSVARLDPLRLIEGIIGGIGFLCAGSIIQSRGSVEGLTTAGSLWFIGAVGVAVGGGHMVIAGTSVALALVVLFGLGVVEKRVIAGKEESTD